MLNFLKVITVLLSFFEIGAFRSCFVTFTVTFMNLMITFTAFTVHFLPLNNKNPQNGQKRSEMILIHPITSFLNVILQTFQVKDRPTFLTVQHSLQFLKILERPRF
jgi:hypothetical protein